MNDNGTPDRESSGTTDGTDSEHNLAGEYAANKTRRSAGFYPAATETVVVHEAGADGYHEIELRDENGETLLQHTRARYRIEDALAGGEGYAMVVGTADAGSAVTDCGEFEKVVDSSRETLFSKEHADGRRTQVHVEKRFGGGEVWAADLVEKCEIGETKIIDADEASVAYAAAREWMAAHPEGVSPPPSDDGGDQIDRVALINGAADAVRRHLDDGDGGIIDEELEAIERRLWVLADATAARRED